MAGHSKWANIQHRKKAQDAKRGKVFTRMIREITVAARQGGDDPASNPRLRLAFDRALAVNMPKDKIEKAAARGAGTDESIAFEEARYEGYGPGGTAILVDCLTDNRNRTVSEVRHAFNKHGGNLGTDGCVAFLFNQCGVMLFPPGTDEDTLMEAALEAGAEDVLSNDDGSFEVITSPETFTEVKDAMLQANLEPADAEVVMRPETSLALSAEDSAKALKLLERLEDLDDVQNVYTNADIQAEAFEDA
ncbi:YebC/PmpR family DNA-binding transcriptional regulator [Spiribacter sp. C176]|uniref:Probable transcriptional regulatory protein GH984_04210 n=1 Tax=Spiribacter salilacus TaxID=2664894 RepID=A0A6N7QPC0_9GAMM|nr:YebC/PmpR family DNA-binding transcriptional regulator [Spiribacter salilacus]MRH77902.1 YebC/PmpR family DNA-binding transcriptional regulator [Spiribacter salilacus]